MDDWEACHAILSKQPQKRTGEEINKLASWVRLRIPVLQELNKGTTTYYVHLCLPYLPLFKLRN